MNQQDLTAKANNLKNNDAELALFKMQYKFPMPPRNATKMEFIVWRFKELGITSSNLAQVVYQKQRVFHQDELTFKKSKAAVKNVLRKREIQHALVTGINLDVLAENNLLVGPLQAIVREDRGTYGVDELQLNLAELYGPIAMSNAQGSDVHKLGIIKEVDQLGKTSAYTTTFLDDLLSLVVGCAEGYLAHLIDHGNDTETENDAKAQRLLDEL